MGTEVIAGDGTTVHKTDFDSGYTVYTVGVNRQWLETKIHEQFTRMVLDLVNGLEEEGLT